jgi:hypothetical protein
MGNDIYLGLTELNISKKKTIHSSSPDSLTLTLAPCNVSLRVGHLLPFQTQTLHNMLLTSLLLRCKSPITIILLYSYNYNFILVFYVGLDNFIAIAERQAIRYP